MIKRIIDKIDRTVKLKQLLKETHSTCMRGGVIVGLSLEPDGNNRIGPNVQLRHCSLGRYSYIGANTKLSRTRIGRYCSISENVSLIAGRHPAEVFVSTHPMFYSNQYKDAYSYHPEFQEMHYVDEENKIILSIGNDVWIGAHAKIIDGITIGDGAIIAAGAVVTKDVPPYAIVGGVPAKLIRYRFETDERKALLDLQWWNKDEDWLRVNADRFANIKNIVQMN